ncbi:MAG TPA: 4-alpha-glucanotransferase [Pyrinomonadaceae bacterium]|nr:4-alpha-glucanotransferase [Pyrinomonadaceae bacterium]
MSFPRTSGILLHPTSLPGRFGVGDLGDAAYSFIDFLAASGQSLWQVLPLGPTGYGDSPYQCFSAFAGNHLLVSPERLVAEGLLTAEDLATVPQFSDERVEFGRVIEYKGELLRRAFENFRHTTRTGLRGEFETFKQHASAWLDDYALYRALKSERGEVAWHEWEAPLVRREPAALDSARERLREAIEAQKFYQYLFFKQWSQLRAYCRERRVRIVGDIPIFVAHDSADVWTQPEQFKLDEAGKPTVVAGVPPDYFSATGQLWGNPIYDWERQRREGFRWWIERVRGTLQTVDILRIDHFRGFAACWEIPAGDTTAERGRWVTAPGHELFTAIREALGELPIIAEDLGVITPDVEALRDHFGFPGMRILQFAFGGDTRNIDLPHNYHRNVVVYTGTHDNDTAVGWFNSEPGEGSTRTAAQIERERAFATSYLNTDGREIHWDFVRAVLASVANTAIIPMQDLLGLGTEARMNLPASTEGNWQWRFRSDAVTTRLAERLRALTELYGRNLQLEHTDRKSESAVLSG